MIYTRYLVMRSISFIERSWRTIRITLLSIIILYLLAMTCMSIIVGLQETAARDAERRMLNLYGVTPAEVDAMRDKLKIRKQARRFAIPPPVTIAAETPNDSGGPKP